MKQVAHTIRLALGDCRRTTLFGSDLPKARRKLAVNDSTAMARGEESRPINPSVGTDNIAVRVAARNQNLSIFQQRCRRK